MKRLFIFIMGVMMAVVATSRTFDMKQLGADAKGIKPCTKLINQTIEKAASEGGGTIYFPAGTYLTATIHMKSNIASGIRCHCALLRQVRGLSAFCNRTLGRNRYANLIPTDLRSFGR